MKIICGICGYKIKGANHNDDYKHRFIAESGRRHKLWKGIRKDKTTLELGGINKAVKGGERVCTR